MTADLQDLRFKMVEGQVRTTDVTDVAVLAAMREIPREEFVPAQRRTLAYIDEDIELEGEEPRRFLMAASPFAKLIQLAELREGDLVLDVGCGAGYSTAVLAHIAGFVVALESDPVLAKEAGRTLAALGCDNVSVVEGQLPGGHAAQAPYDVIVIEGAVEEVPATLIDQLKDGGRLVAVVGAGLTGRATLWRKEDGLVSSRAAFNASIPALDSFRLAPEFTF